MKKTTSDYKWPYIRKIQGRETTLVKGSSKEGHRERVRDAVGAAVEREVLLEVCGVAVRRAVGILSPVAM